MARRRNKHQSLNPSETVAIADAIAKSLNSLFQYGGYALVAYFIAGAIESLAGQLTIADFKIDAEILKNGSIFCPSTYALVFMAILMFIGLRTATRERNLRHANTVEFSQRIEYLEKFIDPKRTSSKLTPHGETRDEDK